MAALIRISELDPIAGAASEDVVPTTRGSSTHRLSLAQIRDYVDAGLYLDERFNCSTLTAGLIGDLNWRFGASAGTPAQTSQEVAGRFGVLRLTTGATSGNDQRIYLSSTPDLGIIDPGNVDHMSWVVSVPTITTAKVRLGLMSSLGSSVGAAGIFFEYDSASASPWSCITRSASTQTRSYSGSSIVAGNWYLLEAIRVSAALWRYQINGAFLAEHSTNIPSGTPLALGARVETSTTAARSVDLDHMVVRALYGQRYT